MTRVQLPRGFQPVTFRGLIQQFRLTMPTLSQQVTAHLVHAGMEPEASLARIPALEAQGLIQFAISQQREPALFIAAESYFQSDLDVRLANALVNFWDIHGTYDNQHRQIVGIATPESVLIVRVQTADGEVVLNSPVAKKLRVLGLLTVDEQGTYHGPSVAQVSQWTDEHGICDFCSDSTPVYTEIVPDFEMPGFDQMSVGGWATCTVCHTLVIENRRTELLRRMIDASQAGKFTAAALKALHAKFWEAWDSKVDAAGIGAALNDFIEDNIQVDPHAVQPVLRSRERRKEAIRRMTGLTPDEMDALGKGDVLYKDTAKKLSAWRKKFGMDGGYVGAKQLARMLNEVDAPKMPPSLQPHWQIALDMKMSALATLKLVENLPKDSPTLSELQWMDWDDDVAALRVAEVFSFNADTMQAIIEGSQSIPHESPLSSIEIPQVRAGWFWFAKPFPVAASPLASETTAALLWSWDVHTEKPSIRFSAYIMDDKGMIRKDHLLPSAKWLWPVDFSFHEMIGLNRKFYRNAYGEGGPFANKAYNIGEEETLKVVAEMSLFFMMACLWFRQTVPGGRKIEPKLTQEPGHIERHARKRYEKEFKITPSVRVIALRKSAASLEPHEPGEPQEGRHLTCRFVVDGHPRLQPYGPGRKEKKLIWIDPYPKGPADAPFKESTTKVFAVIR